MQNKAHPIRRAQVVWFSVSSKVSTIIFSILADLAPLIVLFFTPD